jgi:hypothetical protein
MPEVVVGQRDTRLLVGGLQASTAMRRTTSFNSEVTTQFVFYAVFTELISLWAPNGSPF